jgi:hypothetical protein
MDFSSDAMDWVSRLVDRRPVEPPKIESAFTPRVIKDYVNLQGLMSSYYKVFKSEEERVLNSERVFGPILANLHSKDDIHLSLIDLRKCCELISRIIYTFGGNERYELPSPKGNYPSKSELQIIFKSSKVITSCLEVLVRLNSISPEIWSFMDSGRISPQLLALLWKLSNASQIIDIEPGNTLMSDFCLLFGLFFYPKHQLQPFSKIADIQVLFNILAMKNCSNQSDEKTLLEFKTLYQKLKQGERIHYCFPVHQIMLKSSTFVDNIW